MSLSTTTNPNHDHNRYPRFYLEARMNILYIIEAKILALIKWLYKSIRAPPPPTMLATKSILVITF